MTKPWSALRLALTSVIAFTLAGAGGAAEDRLAYRIEPTRGWVYLDRGGFETRLHGETPGEGGDRVRTAWLSDAVIAAPARGARFMLGPRTVARLASSAPGVLLELRAGRLRAIFDKLLGDDSLRYVTTPGAILAVRGTRFGVAVSRRGTTRVVVFEGRLEVRSRSGLGQAVEVEAGAYTTVALDGAPEPAAPDTWSEEELWEEGDPPPSDGSGPDVQDGPGQHEEELGPSAEDDGA